MHGRGECHLELCVQARLLPFVGFSSFRLQCSVMDCNCKRHLLSMLKCSTRRQLSCSDIGCHNSDAVCRTRASTKASRQEYKAPRQACMRVNPFLVQGPDSLFFSHLYCLSHRSALGPTCRLNFLRLHWRWLGL